MSQSALFSCKSMSIAAKTLFAATKVCSRNSGIVAETAIDKGGLPQLDANSYRRDRERERGRGRVAAAPGMLAIATCIDVHSSVSGIALRRTCFGQSAVDRGSPHRKCCSGFSELLECSCKVCSHTTPQHPHPPLLWPPHPTPPAPAPCFPPPSCTVIVLHCPV